MIGKMVSSENEGNMSIWTQELHIPAHNCDNRTETALTNNPGQKVQQLCESRMCQQPVEVIMSAELKLV